MTTYGFAEDAQVRAIDVRAEAGRMRFTVKRQLGEHVYPDLEVVLSLPGEHNVLNALSAVAVAMELEISDEALLRALDGFRAWAAAFSAMAICPPATAARSPSSTTTVTTRGNGGHAGRGAWRLPGAASGAGLPAAPLQPYARLLRGLCEGHRQCRFRAADRGLCGGRNTDRRRRRPFPGRARVAGKVEPVFVEDINELPAAIAANAQAGDVLLCMGAGSIGAVSGKLVEMLSKMSGLRRKGKRNERVWHKY